MKFLPPHRSGRLHCDVRNAQSVVTDSLRSVDPVTVEFEYELDSTIPGLRTGIYLATTRGEFVFTSFDTDEVSRFDQYTDRKSGHYISRCTIPANMLNEGRYVLGVNASVFKVKSYFSDQNAVILNVNVSGRSGHAMGRVTPGCGAPGLGLGNYKKIISLDPHPTFVVA